MSRIAEQRLSMAECTRDDIAARDLRHASAREFQRVVGRFGVQDFHDEHDTLFARNVRGRYPHFVTQIECLSDRCNLVDDNSLHLFAPRLWAVGCGLKVNPSKPTTVNSQLSTLNSQLKSHFVSRLG